MSPLLRMRMGKLVEQSFGIQLKILRTFGMFSDTRYKKLYTIYAYFIYGVMICPVSVLAVLHLLWDDNIDMDQISDNAFLTCQMACKIVKFLPFVTKPEVIKKSISMLECPLFTNYTKKQEAIIEDCIRVCRRNSWLFFSFCTFSVISLAIKPILRSGRHLPLEVWLPAELRLKSEVYFATYLYVILGVACGGFSNGALDPMIAGLAYQAAAQLKILKNNLQYLNKDAEDIVGKMDSASAHLLKMKLIYEKIGKCIQHHNAILEFVENYENVYSMVVFSQFAASVFVICICCLYLSMVVPFTPIFFAMLIFLTTMLLEIYLYCYYGTTLLLENDSLTNAAYMGEWYNYDIKSKRALLLLMERSKRPMVVTAGKILNLSLETFTTILRRAYSLLAVLKNY